jgi:NADH-quinone oxidoreductase subunit N
VGFAIDYWALAPEIILAVTLMTVLTAELFLPRSLRYITAIIAVMGTIMAMIPLVVLGLSGQTHSMFDGSFVVDDFALVMKGLFLAAGIIVMLMSIAYIEADRFYQGEYYFLMVSSILGSLVMASARDMIILFIGLELVTGPLFLLTGWRKGDRKSNEAALKFFLLGVLSTAILLYGMSFIYGLTGSLTFAGIADASAGLADASAFIMAILFIMVGFAFKISAVPFHFWAPDTYEGAPTPITAYLSVSSKTAGFVGMLVVTYLAFPHAASTWGPALWILAALTMTVGNLTALRQTNIVRLLAYSSVAQAGFMLVPFAVAGVSNSDRALGDAFAATVTYVAVYAFTNLGAFGIVIAAANQTKSGLIERWAGLGTTSPGLATLGTIFFLSLAGIPPFAGWFAKFVMFRSAMGPGNAWTVALAAIAVLNAVIGFYYYARVVKAMWFDPLPDNMDTEVVPVDPALQLSLVLTVAFVIFAGFFPQISAFFGEATRYIASG